MSCMGPSEVQLALMTAIGSGAGAPPHLVAQRDQVLAYPPAYGAGGTIRFSVGTGMPAAPAAWK